MSRIARRQPVFFFEEPLFDSASDEEPRLETRDETSAYGDRITVLLPHLPKGTSRDASVIAQRRLLKSFAPLGGVRPEALTLWYYTPMARSFSDHIEADLVVYDCMDELSAFANPPPGIQEAERDLLAAADVVFTGGPSLYRAKHNAHRNVHEAASSIDRQHFAAARSATELADPADQASLSRPRLGFFGVIDERMDLRLVEEIAIARPDWSLVLIGPVCKIEPKSLPRQPNIHWLGQKTYADLPAYLAHWDAAMMPFAINEATRFISPTKTPEFLAGGVPVVSTPVPDVELVYGRTGLVEIAGDAQSFVNLASKAMARRRTPWLRRVDKLLDSSSWDSTFAMMWSAMNHARGSRQQAALARGLRNQAETGSSLHV